MKEKLKCIRQGDLLFIPEAIPTWLKNNIDNTRKRNGFRKNGIIQEGEATGHHHRIDDLTKAEVFRPDIGNPIIVVGNEGVRVIHQEHGPITLEPNTTYRVHIAREWDLVEGERQVVD